MSAIKRLLDSNDPEDQRIVAAMMLAQGAPTVAKDDVYSGLTPDAKASKRIWPFRRKFKREPLTMAQIVVETGRFDHTLKKTFGWAILAIVVVQIVVANVVMLAYFFWDVGQDGDTAVYVVWISATVVETIGLMTIVTKYLYNSSAGTERSAISSGISGDPTD